MISTVDHHRTPLLDQVAHQAQVSHHRFYMPGHKGGRGSSARLLHLLGRQSLCADVPELPELDQLFAPSGVIQEAQSLAAHAFGAEKTYFLVNGTSVGLMAAVMTLCAPGELILVPRNCHQSIIHGLILSGAYPIWIYPDLEPESYIAHCLSPQKLQDALTRFPQAKAAIAISPTYEGICGDIKSLAAIAHQFDIPLIVDEAHGAHLGFHPDLPPSALSQGADLVVQSTHKTLGALTQASMLHVQGDRVNQSKLQTTLTLLQSSSPNYLLLASLDAARQQMATQGKDILTQAIALATLARHQLDTLTRFKPLNTCEPLSSGGFCEIDPLKLTLTLTRSSLSGFELDDLLSQEYQILAELPAEAHISFVLGLGNSRHDIETLCHALKTIELSHPGLSNFSGARCIRLDPLSPPAIMPPLTPRQASNCPTQPIHLDRSNGQLSANVICPYPPGIPLIFPGEVITDEAIASLREIQSSGGKIVGLQDPDHLNILAM